MKPSDATSAKYMRHIFHKDFVGRNVRVSVDVPPDQIERELRVVVERMVIGIGEHEVSKSFAYPANWWQHFKEDVLPAWFTERWPVKTKIRTLSVKKYDRVCPQFPEHWDCNREPHKPYLEWMTADLSSLDDVEAKYSEPDGVWPIDEFIAKPPF